jgi:hypothetical protein
MSIERRDPTCCCLNERLTASALLPSVDRIDVSSGSNAINAPTVQNNNPTRARARISCHGRPEHCLKQKAWGLTTHACTRRSGPTATRSETPGAPCAGGPAFCLVELAVAVGFEPTEALTSHAFEMSDYEFEGVRRFEFAWSVGLLGTG